MQAKRVLEIGTFTGYSALWMAKALPQDGELITCDVDPKVTTRLKPFLERSPDGHKIHIKIGPALETIKNLKGSFDFIFIDADKANYPLYYEECLSLLSENGLMVFDNMLWSEKVLDIENNQDDSTLAIYKLNKKLTEDKRVENFILPIRDGLHFVRKSPA